MCGKFVLPTRTRLGGKGGLELKRMNQILQQDVSTQHHLSDPPLHSLLLCLPAFSTRAHNAFVWGETGPWCYDLVVNCELLRGRWNNWSRRTGGLYLVSWSSGKQNSSTSLVGMVLIFSDLSAGMLSSRTVPRSGRRSEVLTISRYMKWSVVLERCWPPTILLSSTVAGTLSLLMVTARGPRFSSIPNQFWWSEGGGRGN